MFKLNALATACLNTYSQQVMLNAGAQEGSHMFNLTPPMETKLRQAIMLSDAFLSRVALLPVQQITGQVVDVGDDGLSTGRAKERFSVEVGQDGNTYTLVKTDSGAHINWETMTQWANSGSKDEWMKMMKAAISRRFALDMLRIGFNGTSIAPVTDPTKNPLGQDVNKGWLTLVKEKKTTQVLPSAILDSTGKPPIRTKTSILWCKTLSIPPLPQSIAKIPIWWCSWAITWLPPSSIAYWKRPRCPPSTKLRKLWPRPLPVALP